MSEKVEAKVIDAEEPSIQEKEEIVQKNAGFDEESGVYKVDLSKPPVTEEQPKKETDAVQEQSTDEVPVQDEPETSGEVVEEIRDEEPAGESNADVRDTQEEEVILEEVTDEQTNNDEAAVAAEQEESKTEPVEEQKEESVDLPENVQELVKFMNETGGSMEDYLRLSADYTNVDEKTLLKEYYKQTKPHLGDDEIDFLMEDNFAWDEEIDEAKTIKKKQIALKEAVANAKDFLTGLKDKYYKEVKLGSKLLPEQQKAMDFFNRYNKEQKEADELLAKQAKHFEQETNKVFTDDFKGFNFKVGEKKFRFNVKDVNKVKSQNLSNVFDKYVNENSLLNNAADFHKSLFAASNPDALANHFYEQGKADAIKQMTAEAKNINMDPRKTADGYVEAGGVKVRAISGDSGSGLKIKLRN